MLGLFEFIVFIVSLVCFFNFTFVSNEYGAACIALTVLFWIGKHWHNEYFLFVGGNWKNVNCKQLLCLDNVDMWYDDYNIPDYHKRYQPQTNTTTTNVANKITTTASKTVIPTVKTETTVDIISKSYHRKNIEKVGEPIIKQVERPSKLLTFFGVKSKTETPKPTVTETETKSVEIKPNTETKEKTSSDVEVIMIYNNERVPKKTRRIYDAIIHILEERLLEKTMFYNVLDSIKYIDYISGMIYIYIGDKYILDNDDILPKEEITKKIRQEMGEHVFVNFLEYKVTNIKEYYQYNKTAV